MTIRSARVTDAPSAARLMYAALRNVATLLTGATEEPEILSLLEHFFSLPSNRLSYQQALVKELDQRIVGLILLYGGDEAEKLDLPLLERLRALHQDPQMTFPKEANDDEYYIDTLSVSPEYGGRGIGTELIAAAEERARQHGYIKMSLLVDLTNPRASRLYERLGYHTDKQIQIGPDLYEHKVKVLSSDLYSR
ncbi:GNAT family N-acetyltransferase [Tengunoibacter tsumagoiensis]|uniref:N-acetyltransferase n=1 Tax=Tengunoibacter tsumagoiensis TaxID=2014871 RepID=A0A402A5U4_9CHLR|nr:GNAT family N-acetyltransferase [Tengunoibacter tsumagoiensis]GCE14385.1 N-acetyltransferase [Tengunoibacter tsumagoiensis]